MCRKKWKLRYTAIVSDFTTRLNQMNKLRKAKCIVVWSAKKTAVQLVKSVLVASVFASAIECFYGFVLRAWGTVILDFILSWIMLSIFVMLFFYASERDYSQKNLTRK